VVTLANSGVPYPVRGSGDVVESIELPGVPLGSFFGVSYDEVRLPLLTGDCFVLCSDGVFDSMNSEGEEFTAARLLDVVRSVRNKTAEEIVAAIGQAVHQHRAGFPPNDDTTIVALRITN
jgi:sigma-B regulation protein RsbU (phosphoserine phosphatase)